MGSAQLPGPQPHAQKELMLRLLLSFIHSANFPTRACSKVSSLEMERGWKGWPQAVGPRRGGKTSA